MKKLLTLMIILAVGFFLFNRFGSPLAPSSNAVRYHSDSHPLSFEYVPGESGYYLAETFGPAGIDSDNFIEALTLIPTADHEALLRGERAGGEGPPAMNIHIFINSEKLTPQAWAENNLSLSNYNLMMGVVSEKDVAGHSGISYDADGLYASYNVVFSDNDHIYHLSGQFLDRSAAIYRDFISLIDSIKFND